MQIARKILFDIWSSIIELLAPLHCLICNTYIGNNNQESAFLCSRCYNSLPYTSSSDVVFNHLVKNFPADDLAISNAISLLSVKDDSKIMEVIYALKYKGFTKIGIEFGKLLGNRLLLDRFSKYDALIPVPIHHARKRERGYNQSKLIAEGVGQIIKVPINTNIIKRKIYTQTQTLLKSDERKINVADAFAPTSPNLKLNGKIFLLIDDVLTTGSTLNSCANLLLELGSKRVDVATLVIAN